MRGMRSCSGMTLSSTGMRESSPGFSYHSTEWALETVLISLRVPIAAPGVSHDGTNVNVTTKVPGQICARAHQHPEPTLLRVNPPQKWVACSMTGPISTRLSHQAGLAIASYAQAWRRASVNCARLPTPHARHPRIARPCP